MDNTKKYLCKRCDRSFARSEHLQRHERSHTKEKPFRCTICTKAFTRKDLLSRHTRISHGSLECNTMDVARTKNATSSSSSSSLTRDLSSALPFNSPDFMISANQSPVENRQLQLSNTPIVHSLEESDEITAGQYTAVASSLGFVQENRVPSHMQTLSPLHSSFDSSIYIADDFTSFLDSVSVPGHPYSPTYQPLPPFVNFSLPQFNENEIGHDDDAHHQRVMTTEYGSRRSRLGSRLPSLTPEETQNNYRTALEPKINPTIVTSRCRDRILASLAHNTDPLVERLTLPSRHALSRFISGYITGFHDHYPFLHIATLNVEIIAVELILAISALGAQYCREPKQSVELFHIAKVVAMGHIHSSQSRVGRSASNTGLEDSPDKEQISPADQAPILPANRDHTTATKQGNIETVQALLLLIALATWFREHPPFHEALYLRSVLDTLTRSGGFEVHSNDDGGSWEEWIRLETMKRTKFIVFCFFNIHTIVFDLPPMMLSGEIVSSLPCTEKEWKAENKSSWQAVRNSQEPEPSFREVLRSLFDYDSNPRKATRFSSLGGYILIHALIQHIWILRQVAWLPPRNSESLNPTEIKSLEQALKRWRYCWERNRESSLDPLSPHGPLAFTSTALLRLAYIRISTDVSCVKLLSTWNPYQIAQSLSRSPPTQRGERVHMAALHCAHALSIPIKLGINFVAQTQVVLWSNQHALCSLECAFLLTNWLQSVTVRGIQPNLTQQEMRLLDFIIEMVMETEYKAERDWLLDNNKRLSAIVARLWAKLFRSDGIWEMVALIGKSLNMYADILDSQSM